MAPTTASRPANMATHQQDARTSPHPAEAAMATYSASPTAVQPTYVVGDQWIAGASTTTATVHPTKPDSTTRIIWATATTANTKQIPAVGPTGVYVTDRGGK